MPTGGPAEAPDQQLSEEQIQQYLGELRNAPVEQVLAEICSALINAVQVKLGRPDGRLLIDVLDGVTGAARGKADDELVRQLDEALAQLRLAQVEGEKEASSDTDSESAAPPADEPPSAGSGQPSGKRLWTPGA